MFNRSLNLDIVKIFLLKHTNMNRVIVNDILFAESNYETVKVKVGAQLVRNLEVVLRLLELLMELDYPNVILAKKVHWNSAILNDDDEDDDDRF